MPTPPSCLLQPQLGLGGLKWVWTERRIPSGSLHIPSSCFLAWSASPWPRGPERPSQPPVLCQAPGLDTEPAMQEEGCWRAASLSPALPRRFLEKGWHTAPPLPSHPRPFLLFHVEGPSPHLISLPSLFSRTPRGAHQPGHFQHRPPLRDLAVQARL